MTQQQLLFGNKSFVEIISNGAAASPPVLMGQGRYIIHYICVLGSYLPKNAISHGKLESPPCLPPFAGSVVATRKHVPKNLAIIQPNAQEKLNSYKKLFDFRAFQAWQDTYRRVHQRHYNSLIR